MPNGKLDWQIFLHLPLWIGINQTSVIKMRQMFKAMGLRLLSFLAETIEGFHATKDWLKIHNVPFDLLVLRLDKFKDESIKDW